MNTHDLAVEIVETVVHCVDHDTAIHDVQALLDAHVTMRPPPIDLGQRWVPVTSPLAIDRLGVGRAVYLLDPPVQVVPTDQCWTSTDGVLTVAHADGTTESFRGELENG